MGEELKYATMLVHCGELRIEYIDMDTSFTGSLTEKNDQYVMILNSRLSAEYNFKKLLHEIKHLKHIKSKLNNHLCEEEAKNFESYPVDYSQLVNFIDWLEHMFVKEVFYYGSKEKL